MKFKRSRRFFVRLKTQAFLRRQNNCTSASLLLVIRLKSLEMELGVTLFNRSNTGLKMTEAGQLLLPWARCLLHDMQDLKEMMASPQEMFAGELRIVCSTSVGKYILPNWRPVFVCAIRV